MPFSWKLSDYIRWAEMCLKAKSQPDLPFSRIDLEAWLAKKRDGNSLAEIAREQYPKSGNKSKRRNQAPISEIRRKIARVEVFFNSTGSSFGYSKRWLRGFRKRQDERNRTIRESISWA